MTKYKMETIEQGQIWMQRKKKREELVATKV